MNFIQNIIEKYALFGKQPDGSISRTFGSEAYLEASLELKKDMEQLGLDSYIDAVGNVHGIFNCAKENGCEVIIGSHLDTVKNGGRFDGIYGIVSGLYCVKKLRQNNVKLPFKLHIIATNGEEGNILGGTFGSRCITGGFSEDILTDTEFKNRLNKITVDALTHCELSAQAIREAQMDFDNVKCYLEAHIEQGSTLEKEKKDIGIVTGIVGLRRYSVCVYGKRNHSGTTKMEYRDDALVKAAQIILFSDNLARRLKNDFVATIQKVSVTPNELAVINDKVEMVLEIRNLSEELMGEYISELETKCRELGNITIEQLVEKKPVLTDINIQKAIRNVCDEQSISCCNIPSGATHDANMFGKKTPVGMIFVPSRGGESHSRHELTEWEQCETGADVLYETILKLAE